MGILTYPYTLTAGQPENVNQLNANLSAILAILNGSVDAANLAANAVTTAKITDANVTRAKLATDALNNFPKLVTAADIKVNFGTATALYSSATTTTLTVTHGLGVTPSFISCTPVDGGTNLLNVVPGVISARSATQFTVIFGNIGGAYAGGETVKFQWLALG